MYKVLELYSINACLEDVMENSDKKKHLIDIIIYAMMIVAVGYIIVQTILGNNTETSFKITLGLWMLGAVIVSDFIEPLICENFNNMTGKAAAMYGLYAVCDAVAYASLYIFIINIGFTKEPVHYIFLGIAVLFFIGRISFGTLYKNAESKEDDIKVVETEPVLDDNIEVNTLSVEDEDDIKVLVYRNRNK